MSRDINPFGLRMPIELREQVTAAAQTNGRSLNTEIVKRLQESFERESWLKKSQEEMTLDEILQKLQEISFQINQIRKQE